MKMSAKEIKALGGYWYRPGLQWRGIETICPWWDDEKWERQVAQLLQRDCAAGFVSHGQKWKTGTGRQYLWTL